MATVTAGDLIGAGWGVLTRQWRWLLGGGVVSAAMQAAQKGAIAGGKGGIALAVGLTLLVMLAQFLVHAVIARRALEAEGLVLPGTPARYGHYLLTTVIVTVGAMLGAMVLVVPGVMALLRWFLSVNYVLARGMSCTQALAASRDATRGHRWGILWAWMALAVAAGVPYLATLWAAGGLVQLAQVPLVSGLGVMRLVWAAAATALSVAFSIGVYSVLSRVEHPLSEVFA